MKILIPVSWFQLETLLILTGARGPVQPHSGLRLATLGWILALLLGLWTVLGSNLRA